MLLRLGVKCVTVFASSIENFKRSEDEVSALVDLAEVKLLELTEHRWVLDKPHALLSLTCTWVSGTLDRYSVELNVLGEIGILPENVQKSVRIAQAMTRNNHR